MGDGAVPRRRFSLGLIERVGPARRLRGARRGTLIRVAFWLRVGAGLAGDGRRVGTIHKGPRALRVHRVRVDGRVGRRLLRLRAPVDRGSGDGAAAAAADPVVVTEVELEEAEDAGGSRPSPFLRGTPARRYGGHLHLERRARRAARRAGDLDRSPVVLGRDDSAPAGSPAAPAARSRPTTRRPAGAPAAAAPAAPVAAAPAARLRRDLGRDRRRRRRLGRADGRHVLGLPGARPESRSAGVHDPPRALGLASSIFVAHARLRRRGAAAHG